MEKDYLIAIVWTLTSQVKVYLLEYTQTLIGILYVTNFSAIFKKVHWKHVNCEKESFPGKDMHSPGGFSIIQNYCIQAIFVQLCQLFPFISLIVSFEKEW